MNKIFKKKKSPRFDLNWHTRLEAVQHANCMTN